MNRQIRIFVVIAVLLAALNPGLTDAQEISLPDGFDPNYILADKDIFDVNSLTYEQLESFLRSKGTLGNRRLKDIDGQEKPTADIIWRVAHAYKINPKYLLALLQKEQSLVEDPNPTQDQFDWATGYAICDNCSKNDPAVQEFRGFAAQLEWAAKQHREKYLIQLLSRGLTIGGQGIGKAVSIDGRSIAPANHATAMLYSYTPHIKGNLNLWKIWKRWFSTIYPEGTVVHVKATKQTYLLRFGEKRPFASPAVVASLVDEEKIIETTEQDLAVYQTGKAIKFPKYALVRDTEERIYLLLRDAKRQIADIKTFRTFGFNEDEIIDATDEDLNAYPDGPKITLETRFPQGVLMKTADSRGVWYIEDGKRQALLDGVLLKLYFSGRRIRTVNAKTLEQYPVTEPYRLHAGELVKSAASPAIYVVENSLLRPIPSGEVFEQMGWKWKNVVTVPNKLLALHEIGLPIASEPDDTQFALIN